MYSVGRKEDIGISTIGNSQNNHESIALLDITQSFVHWWLKFWPDW